MYQPLPVNEAQVELSEKTKTTICLRDPIVRIVLLVLVRARGVGPFNRHVLPGEPLQTEDQGERGPAWQAGRQV